MARNNRLSNKYGVEITFEVAQDYGHIDYVINGVYHRYSAAECFRESAESKVEKFLEVYYGKID